MQIRRAGRVVVALLGIVAVLVAAPADPVGAAPSGSITGRVTADDGGAPLSGICVRAQDGTTGVVQESAAPSAADGTYTVGGLPTGVYTATFYDCQGTGFAVGENYGSPPTQLTVIDGAPTEHIDASLAQGGMITGVVKADDTSAPLADICVSTVPSTLVCATSQADGSYQVRGVPVGSVKVRFSDPALPAQHLPEYYNDSLTSGGALAVPVTVGVVTPGIDASLALAGHITGTVVADDTGLPLSGVCVSAVGQGGGATAVANGTTEADGTYDVGGLRTGSYTVGFVDGTLVAGLCFPGADDTTRHYLPETFDDTNGGSSDPVAVTIGATTPDVDASLARGGDITGIVTSDLTGLPLGGVCVLAQGGTTARAITAADGSYDIGGLPTDSYLVSFVSACAAKAGRYTREYYDDVQEQGSAHKVAVTAPAVTPNIDAGLSFRIDPPGDFDGSGATDVAVFRPSNGTWYASGQPTVAFGATGDIPVPGFWTGRLSRGLFLTALPDIAVFRPSTGRWYIKGLPGSVAFGTAGDIPVPGDYDGDGRTDIAVFRPSTGRWYIQGKPTVAFGTNGDIPVPGQWDSDEATDIAVFRPSTGRWYIDGVPGSVAFGLSGDIPVPGDYDGDGHTDIAVFRPSKGYWYTKDQPTVAFGTTGDVPVPGQWSFMDPAWKRSVFRPSSGKWYRSGTPTVAFGLATDVLVGVPPATRSHP